LGSEEKGVFPLPQEQYKKRGIHRRPEERGAPGASTLYKERCKWTEGGAEPYDTRGLHFPKRDPTWKSEKDSLRDNRKNTDGNDVPFTESKRNGIGCGEIRT